MLWTPDIVAGEVFLNTSIQLVMIVFLVTLVIDNKNDLLLGYQSYLFGNLIGSGIIIYNYLNGIESIYYQRYAIPVLDIDGQSIMLTLTIPMSAYLATQATSKLTKILYTCTILTIVFAIILTGTRTAAIVCWNRYYLLAFYVSKIIY